MTLGQDPLNPSRTLPTLSAIQHRRRELLAYQGRQESAQTLATPTEGDNYEEVHLTQEQEKQKENNEQQEPYAEENSEPSVKLPHIRRIRRLRRTLPHAVRPGNQPGVLNVVVNPVAESTVEAKCHSSDPRAAVDWRGYNRG